MTTSTTELEGTNMRTTRRVILWGSRAVSYFVYVYILFVEIILSLGFFFLLFGANPSASFTEWLYRSLERAMEPFRGIFTPIELGTTSGSDVLSVFDTSVLFAMIVYMVLGLVVHAFIAWLSTRLYRLDVEEERLRREALIGEEVARRQMAVADTQAGLTPPDFDASQSTGL
jgi:hypothetical protein